MTLRQAAARGQASGGRSGFLAAEPTEPHRQASQLPFRRIGGSRVRSISIFIALAAPLLADTFPFDEVQPELFARGGALANAWADFRSEEHTSELQSLRHL